MACDPTELGCVCIAGQLEPAICDPDGLWPELRVVANLVSNAPGPLIDPTNCAIVVDTRIVEINESTDGCWCIGPLMPNYHDDPEQAIQPGGTYWEISVQALNDSGSYTTVMNPVEIVINGSLDYTELDEDCCLIQTACGQCVNIVCLMDPAATVPPTNRFCDAVHACLAPITGTGLLSGKVTGDYQDGWIIDLTCEDLASCIPTGFLQCIGGSTLRFGDDINGTLAEISLLHDNPDNILSAAPSGECGLSLTCADVNDCVFIQYVPFDPTVHDGGPVEGAGSATDPYQVPLPPEYVYVPWDPTVHAPGPLEGDGTAGDPYQVPVMTCDDIRGCVWWQYITYDPAVHVPGQVLGSGTETDPYQIPLPCCPEFTYVPWDPAVHDAGVVEGSGTATDPYQIPLPQIDVEIENIAITNTTVDADGNTVVTYTVTETDDGDGDPPTHSFDVTFPAAAEMNFEYVVYDPAIHDPGVVEGDGTSANPWQIPLPDICTLLDAVAAATDSVVPGTDEVLVYDPVTGTCARKTIAPAASETPLVVTTDGNTTGVTQSGTADHTADITVTSTDATNIASIGTDGGTLVTCDDVLGCIYFQYVAYDPATMTAGTVSGTGTETDPYLVPLPCCEEWAYVAYDPAVHDVGVIEGTGTASDPLQIPLPADLCAMIAAMDPATGSAVATDEIVVIQSDGTCARKTIPPGTTDTNTTYVLNDDDTSTIHLVDDQGNPAGSIPLCDLIDDMTVAATLAAGALVLSYDPAAGTCSLVPLPAGTTDTNTTYTLSDDDTSTIHLVDDQGNPAGSIPLCDLIDDLTTLATAPAGSLVLTFDPAAGTCSLAPPAAAGETYTLSDDDTAAIHLVDSSGTAVSTIPLCDLVDDLTALAAPIDGALYLSWDPATGECGLAPRETICKQIAALTDTATTLPTDGTIKVVGHDPATGDCALYTPPAGGESCCASEALVDPATGEPVVMVIDTVTGDVSYYNSDGTAWAGDPTTLTAPVPAQCDVSAGGLTATQVGAFYFSCSIETYNGGTPEGAWPAANFPDGWTQMFIKNSGGEEWVVIDGSWVQLG